MAFCKDPNRVESLQKQMEIARAKQQQTLNSAAKAKPTPKLKSAAKSSNNRGKADTSSCKCIIFRVQSTSIDIFGEVPTIATKRRLTIKH